MDSSEIGRAVDDLARTIASTSRAGVPLAIVGIRTRGLTLAKRLVELLRDRHSISVEFGALDITLYRDDLSHIAHSPVLRGTEVPFGVDDKDVVLVDDVLFTGRTIRAAMDVMFDLGRPGAIRLAVLIDRGHRELPIQPDYCACRVTTGRDERVTVRLKENDGVDEVCKESMS